MDVHLSSTIKEKDKRALDIKQAIKNIGLSTDNIIIIDNLPENRKPIRDALDMMQAMIKKEMDYWYCKDAPKTCELVSGAIRMIWRMYSALENKDEDLWWRVLCAEVKIERQSNMFMKSFKSPPGKSKEYKIKRKKFMLHYSKFIKLTLDTI